LSFENAYTGGNSGHLFAFDPNTVSLETLQELGLSERAAQNLIHYREKGGRFRNPEDLKKLYSLKPEDAQRLIPFVRINNEGDNPVNTFALIEQSQEDAMMIPVSKTTPAATTKPFSKLTEPMDINLADSFSLTLLPGIGAKRAGAICRYREKLGGFATLEQVGETYGLPDSVFQQILPYITIGSGPANKICLNTATETDLKNHPYIGWKMAKIIVAFRNQHGNFQSVEDLAKIYAVKKDWLEKMKPFLKTES
jgi:competence ComEA-like helix-hairpin-helix protein